MAERMAAVTKGWYWRRGLAEAVEVALERLEVRYDEDPNDDDIVAVYWTLKTALAAALNEQSGPSPSPLEP